MKSKRYISLILITIILALSFQSCRKVTLQLEKVPANTPHGSPVYVTGNFNFWDPGDERYIMDYDSEKGYSLTLPVTFGNIEYKYTRGDWSTVERDRCGRDIENRRISDFKNRVVTDRIESWADLEPLDCDSVTIVITSLPRNTPKDAVIRIAGNFNAWNPGNDSAYVFKKDLLSGHYKLNLIRQAGMQLKDFRYKIVRNSLSEAESDKFGNELETRRIDLSQSSNFIELENWTDLAEPALNAITIVLKRIPKTTPDNSFIYLTGNFNNWNPGDKNYIFRMRKNGIFAISIPRQKYGLSFKITRGSWDTEAADTKGENFDNFDFNYDEVDSIFVEIDNWKDIRPRWPEYFTFIINEMPQSTPPSDPLELQGTYNEWNSIEGPFTFRKNEKGNYILRVRKKQKDNFEYRITRGSWTKQEVYTQAPRRADPWEDTIFVTIEKWSDQINRREELIRIEIIKIPGETPGNDKLYIAGPFNGWNPGHKDFVLQKENNGKYFIVLPRSWLKEGFKFTRGHWRSVEADSKGNFVENRFYKGNSAIIEVSIEGWED